MTHLVKKANISLFTLQINANKIKYEIINDQTLMGQWVKTALGMWKHEFAITDKACATRSDTIQAQFIGGFQGLYLQQNC